MDQEALRGGKEKHQQMDQDALKSCIIAIFFFFFKVFYLKLPFIHK